MAADVGDEDGHNHPWCWWSPYPCSYDSSLVLNQMPLGSHGGWIGDGAWEVPSHLKHRALLVASCCATPVSPRTTPPSLPSAHSATPLGSLSILHSYACVHVLNICLGEPKSSCPRSLLTPGMIAPGSHLAPYFYGSPLFGACAVFFFFFFNILVATQARTPFRAGLCSFQ